MKGRPVHACKCRRSPDRYLDAVPGHVLLCCLRCLGYLPMGASRDVAVEVRGAELSNLATSHADHMESAGWSAWAYDGTPLKDERWHAGWLGRAIHEHRKADRMAEARDRAAALTPEDRARMGIPEGR